MSTPAATPDATPARPAFAGWIRGGNDLTQQFLSLGGRPEIISLAGGLPAAELYPLEAVRAATQRVFDVHGTAALEYGPIEGFPALRALIAARISAQTGGQFSADNVLLTSGSMQGLDLVGKVLIDKGDLIVTQAPTYLGALDAWRAREPVYRALDWQAPAEADLRAAKFVYTVPNYSNPTGVLVAQVERARLLDRVLEAGTWLVEDDPYLSIQFDGPPGASILAHYVARNPGPYEGPVLYTGTVSKSLAPGLRVGWVIAAPAMIRTLSLAKQSSDMSSSMLTQAITLELMNAGVDVEHSLVTVEAYRQRRDALCEAAERRLRNWFDWETPVGGMFVWMRAKGDIDTDVLYRYALEEKVAFVPSSVFDFTGEDRRAMRLNFTRSAPEVLAEGVRRLERAVVRYLSARLLDTP
jgi:2-aminoadipate transaminase